LNIEDIQGYVRKNEFILSAHAHEERQNEDIKTEDIRQAILDGRIIEDYPDDRRGPSCLILGHSRGRSLHIVCGRATNGLPLIITVYIPREPKWLSPEIRRERHSR